MFWNGGTVNAFMKSPPADIVPAVASGGDIEKVMLSNRSNAASPHSFAAAICSITAWADTFTAGNAMRSPGLKSRMLLIRGSFDVSRTTCCDIAAIPPTSCGVPLVLAHIVSSPGTPPDAISTAPDSSASFIMSGPLKTM